MSDNARPYPIPNGSFPINLDLTASFVDVKNPTAFGIYDNDASFQADANSIVKYVDRKLGGSILDVELRNPDVYTCFEEAILEYSGYINAYQAKSVLAAILTSQTGTLQGHENQVPRFDLSLLKREAQAYSTEVGVGGTKTLYSGSIVVTPGQQTYDLNALFLSASGMTGTIEIKELFHFSPTAAYRFFDTTSAVNYLHNEFNFESFTPETIFYLLPIWEDVLRGMELDQSQRIRRSNYSYNVINNVAYLYPVPDWGFQLHFTYYVVDGDVYPENDPATNGVANVSNAPFGNIAYSGINSIGRQWIRRFCMALVKEVLGQVRGKIVSGVPIPNGVLQLNGADLISQGREEQQYLRDELKNLLDSMTYPALAQQQADQAENMHRQLSFVPMKIYVG